MIYCARVEAYLHSTITPPQNCSWQSLRKVAAPSIVVSRQRPRRSVTPLRTCGRLKPSAHGLRSGTRASTAPKFSACTKPMIIRCASLSETERRAGGVYLWETRSAAEAVYNGEWKARVKQLYGSEPEISWFDTPGDRRQPSRWRHHQGGVGSGATCALGTGTWSATQVAGYARAGAALTIGLIQTAQFPACVRLNRADADGTP